MFFYPDWASVSLWMYVLLVTAVSVFMTIGANLARFGMIAPILMHAMWNTSGSFFNALFTDAQPGSGGFLQPLLSKMPVLGHFHLHVPFDLVITLGGWTFALLVIAATKRTSRLLRQSPF